MPRQGGQQDLEPIEEVVRRHSEGVTAQEIATALPSPPPRRTLQFRLKRLVEQGRLFKEGNGRWTRYRAAPREAPSNEGPPQTDAAVALSPAGVEIGKHVRQSVAARRPVGYNRAFLDTYKAGDSFYLNAAARKHLRKVGTPTAAEQPAGTYAKRILSRLLIDLSWNSSRLEGNTYSLLDTRRLIELGKEAEGKQRLEAQMILNHKDAIEFLVGAPEEIGFNRYTILNLHALLVNNLLTDSQATGRLRYIGVGIERSVFHPLEMPQLIEECFDQALATATAIDDPFEQAFFAMVQLPYLQPFDDGNKRVSRLAANIPLIKENLSPLSFEDVPRDLYTDAVLGVYELNRVELLRDVFIWAYERSAARYAAVRQSLGEPDPFRLKHRSALRELIAAIVREHMDRTSAAAHLAAWTQEHIDPQDRERFREIAESELFGLHDGNFARYRIRPSEFAAWRKLWKG